MKLSRRIFLQFAAAAIPPVFSRIAAAQTYPNRSITMIVPFAVGGSADVVGRVVAERMSKSLGQPIIIENISGAEGRVGTGRAAHARPDGYTMDLGIISTHVLNGALYSLQYDVLNDFAPISALLTFPYILFGRKTIPAKDLIELIAWLKANPNRASAGFATAGAHLLSAFLQKETGTHFTIVPYRGGALAMQDLVAGQIDLVFYPPDGLPLARAGNIKAYAVTSDMRLTAAPDIRTVGEMGLPALSFSNWQGLFAPRGTPKEIIGMLNAAAVEALDDPAIRSRFVDFGFEVFPREQQSPEALGALVKADAEKWWPIIKEFAIKGE
jgi:tripartite-type tricarboxylate transporter receptor subunit TctC